MGAGLGDRFSGHWRTTLRFIWLTFSVYGRRQSLTIRQWSMNGRYNLPWRRGSFGGSHKIDASGSRRLESLKIQMRGRQMLFEILQRPIKAPASG